MYIQWTSGEKERLAEKTLEILDASPSLTRLQAFNRAQPVVLTSNRIRKIAAMSMIPWLDNEITSIKRIRAAKARQEQQEQLKIAPIQSLVQEKSLTLKGITSDLLVMELLERLSSDRDIRTELKEIKSLFNDSVASLRTFIKDELQRHQDDTLEYLNLISDQLKKVSEAHHPQVTNHKKHRKMVLLVCLKKNQFNEVVHEFEDILDLRLWNQDDSNDKLKSMCSNAYKIFGMTDFMSHSYAETINSVNAAAFTPFTGGVTTLKNELRKLVSEIQH